MTDPNCLFCKIIKGESPSQKVYEDETAFAFLDILAIHPGHTLVVPKTHYKNIFDMPEAEFGALAGRSKKIAEAVRAGVGAEGVNITMNNEPAAGQLVPHAHLHIIPRYAKDGYKHWVGTPYEEGEDAKTAEKIRNAIK
ncbi:HIT family protein [Candidatus Parcubacteria bacterium]|nr:HIT family protein [Candidatus Parcubacteria bacterium]